MMLKRKAEHQGVIEKIQQTEKNQLYKIDSHLMHYVRNKEANAQTEIRVTERERELLAAASRKSVEAV